MGGYSKIIRVRTTIYVQRVLPKHQAECIYSLEQNRYSTVKIPPYQCSIRKSVRVLQVAEAQPGRVLIVIGATTHMQRERNLPRLPKVYCFDHTCMGKGSAQCLVKLIEFYIKVS